MVTLLLIRKHSTDEEMKYLWKAIYFVNVNTEILQALKLKEHSYCSCSNDNSYFLYALLLSTQGTIKDHLSHWGKKCVVTAEALQNYVEEWQN